MSLVGERKGDQESEQEAGRLLYPFTNIDYLNARSKDMLKKTALLAAVFIFVSVVVVRLAVPTTAAQAKGDAKAGLEVYKKTCLRCHGEQCKGDGPGAKLLKTKPADWTDKATMSKLTENDLFTAISKGTAAVGKSSAMPGFGDQLKQQDIRNLVAYVHQVEGK
jgi:mono/diheme cytochrome c family protein